MTGAPAAARYEVATVEGPAHVRVVPGQAGHGAAGTLLLGHGAGGQRDTADLVALTGLAGSGWTVVLVDQPWRVAGRTVATPPPTLDRAWLDVVQALSAGAAPDGTPLPRPWVYGGRSAGARVAARTSVATDGLPVPGVAGVVCLSFPLHPPGRPDRSRAEELARPLRAGLPVLVVQGERDPMGTPAQVREAVPAAGLTVSPVAGAHAPTRDLARLTRAVLDHLARLG